MYSAAVYQPKGYKYPKVAWTDIRDASGKWTRPREFLDHDDPALAYFDAMLAHYDARLDEAREWAQNAPDKVALCCWCPYDRAAKRQIEEFGSFICHTGPLGLFIEDRLGVTVTYDIDRDKMYFPREAGG